MEELWQRVSQGKHTAVVGLIPGPPPAALGLRVLRVRCDVPQTALGPLLEVRRKVDQLLGGAPPLLDKARSRVVAGLRRRLLGDVAEGAADAELLEACYRLAQSAEQRWALVFEAIEAADEATLDVLRRLVTRPDALKVTLVLAFRAPATGPAAALLAAVRAIGGAAAILQAPGGQEGEGEGEGAPEIALRDLPAEALRVLRAGAVVGPGFEVELVAELLDMAPIAALEALQGAADAGVALEDRGEGRFHLPAGLHERLRASILPSLARAWHRRMAEILSAEDEGEEAQEAGEGPPQAEDKTPASKARASVTSVPPTQNTAAPGAPGAAAAAAVAPTPPPRGPDVSVAMQPARVPVFDAPPPAAAPPTPPAAAPPPRPAGSVAKTPVAPAPPTPRDGMVPGASGARPAPADDEMKSSEPGLPVAKSSGADKVAGAADKAAAADPKKGGGASETLRPPPSAAVQEEPGRSRRPPPPVIEEKAPPLPAPPAPAAPAWAYAEIFSQEGETRPSEPPESFVLDAPPDSLDAPIPGPVRMPREVESVLPGREGPSSARGASSGGFSISTPGTPRGSVRSGALPPVIPVWTAPPRDRGPASGRGPGSMRAMPPPAPFAPAAPPPGEPPAKPAEEAAAPRRQRPAAAPAAGRRADEARAADHLTAAGELDAAAERYGAAAAQAAAIGAYAQALAYGQKALALLDALPQSRARRQTRVRILIEVARVQWQAAGPDPAFTLGGALEVLDAARGLLAQDDPPWLHAEVAILVASVCYDVGDLRSLERALNELTAASRLLLQAGEALGAARLLNDQAAVYVRMGDPVRATHLLSESRKIFEERAGTDPVAKLETAETDHLFARIPLHVAARPGRESDALSMGLDHALAAERTYKQLGASRELGRVWETMGRLELRKGRLDRATERLGAAVELQQGIGDLVGLARSTAALSEVLSAKGKQREALLVLSDSVTLNVEKGSPIGLAYNRRALNALAPNVSLQGESAEALRKVAMQLSAAESALGRIKLPGERD